LNHHDEMNAEELELNNKNIEKLYQLLNLPLTGSYNLKQHMRHWNDRVDEMAQIQDTLQSQTCLNQLNLDVEKLIKQI
ncbi:hypothetical protein ACYT6H_10545, partial [Streptococcus pyogenes]